jgi:hypothetical protein
VARSRRLKIPVEDKVRVVLSVLAGEMSAAEAVGGPMTGNVVVPSAGSGAQLVIRLGPVEQASAPGIETT